MTVDFRDASDVDDFGVVVSGYACRVFVELGGMVGFRDYSELVEGYATGFDSAE